MSDKVFDQDTNDRVLDRPQMLIVQLLFREKPAQASAEALQAAFEPLVGNVENISKDKHDFTAFAVPKYKAVFKDVPQGMPVLANFSAPREFTSEKFDDFQRSQFWDVKGGSELIDKCKFAVDIFAMSAAVLHYKEQAELILAQVSAALKCYPTCDAIYVHTSGKLTTPKQFEDCKQYDLSGRFIRLAVNARFFNIQGTEDDMIVDTLGFYAFGAADVQMHFHGIDPNYVVNYVYNLASYQFDNEFPIKSGDTVDSIGADGSMQWEPQWKAQYEDSLIQPVRTVLDVNCGEYAAGNRS